MEPRDREVVTMTLDSLEKLVRMFWMERILHMLCALTAFALLVYATYLMISANRVDAAQLGLIFGATGVAGVSGARIAYFLNQAFRLVELVISRIAGIEVRNDRDR